jgi:hypothetical protein
MANRKCSDSLLAFVFEDRLPQILQSNNFRRAVLSCCGLTIVTLLATGAELGQFLVNRASSQPAHYGTTQPRKVRPTGASDARRMAELINRAQLLTAQKKYRAAEDAYRSILESDPSNVRVKQLLASALFRDEKIDDCIEVLNSISAGKPLMRTSVLLSNKQE